MSTVIGAQKLRRPRNPPGALGSDTLLSLLTPGGLGPSLQLGLFESVSGLPHGRCRGSRPFEARPGCRLYQEFLPFPAEKYSLFRPRLNGSPSHLLTDIWDAFGCGGF